MPSTRRRLLLMSFVILPGIIAHAQDSPIQDRTRGGRRRPDGSEDPSNNPNSTNSSAAASKAILEERQKNIKKDVEKL